MRIAFQLGFRIRTAGQRPSITRGQSCSFSLEAWTSFRWFVLSVTPMLHSIKRNHSSIGFGSMEGSTVLFLGVFDDNKIKKFHQPKPVSIVWNRIFMLWNGIFYFYQERTQVREMFRHKRCFQQPWRATPWQQPWRQCVSQNSFFWSLTLVAPALVDNQEMNHFIN